MTKIPVEDIRAAAAGRCPEILSALCGLSPEQLDPKRHQPCPKCRGEDRYRAFDDVRETGGLLCNQCGKFSDLFASIQWLRGCDFKTACGLVADHLGVKASRKKAADTDPAKDLEFLPWSSTLAALLVAKKPGYSESALLAAGGRFASYKRNYSVIAFPVIGESLDIEKPVGWVLISATGGTIPRWDRNGSVVEQLKVKVTHGSKPGLVGLHAIERLKLTGMVDEVWKVEGISDLISLLAKIPAASADRHVAVTNAHGCGEKPGWMGSFLAAYNVNLVHDADHPGQTGAVVWCQNMAGQDGKPRNVKLPYPLQENRGKDLRDWLSEGNDYADLLHLASTSEVVAIKKTESGEIDYKANSYPVQEQILRKLQIEVLYETGDGRIRVFSHLLGKSSWIKFVARLKKEELVQICGPPAMSVISAEPDNETCWNIADVRTAIALAASMRREESNERGIGIWQGRDENGNETDVIVLVNDTEAARLNGNGLERVITPRTDGLVLDLGSGRHDWYDFDDLKRHLESAKSQDWCNETIKITLDLFARWRWANPSVDPLVVTGLVLASWVQTLWAWRPLVAVVAASNTGKSLLFEALGGTSDGNRGMFGALSLLQAKSTDAGIRHAIKNTGKVILCDEFEASVERDKILETLRASTRGSQTTRGTANQQGSTFALRHLAWVANTESGLKKQPDLNRFIQLVLNKAAEGQHGKLVLPDGDSLQRLGQKLLAIAITHALAAKQLAVTLKKTQVPGIEPRLVEVYAVPAAMLGLASGYDEAQSTDLLLEMLSPVDQDGQEAGGDEQQLLDDILSAVIICPKLGGSKSVAQLMDLFDGASWQDAKDALRTNGVDYEVALDGTGLLYISHKQIARRLLADTPWRYQTVRDILQRHPRLLSPKPARRYFTENHRPMCYCVRFPNSQNTPDF